MQQDTLIKMETFIANVLRNSPLISADIQVVNLADTQDEEGIVQMPRSITVRYTNSSSRIYTQSPMTLARSINFEVIHANQSYLTRQAHEMVLEACTGAYMALTSQVPCNTGVEILKGFHMSSETFQGISESKHYVYVQKWELLATEQYRALALDPAVTKGYCHRLFPQKFISVIEPGEFLHQGKLYEPIFYNPKLSDEHNENWNPQKSGVKEVGNNLVFTEDESIIFQKDWTEATYTAGKCVDEPVYVIYAPKHNYIDYDKVKLTPKRGQKLPSCLNQETVYVVDKIDNNTLKLVLNPEDINRSDSEEGKYVNISCVDAFNNKGNLIPEQLQSGPRPGNVKTRTPFTINPTEEKLRKLIVYIKYINPDYNPTNTQEEFKRFTTRTHIYVNKNNKGVVSVALAKLDNQKSTSATSGDTMAVLTQRGYGVVNKWRTEIYVDPTKENSVKLNAKLGDLLTLQLGVQLTVDGVKYQRVGELSVGKAWIKVEDLDFCEVEDMEPIAKYLGYENPEPGSC